MRVRRTGTPIERLLSRIEIGDEHNGERCWLWTGPVTREGYAKISVGGKMRLAHRIAYEAIVGPIPKGMVCDHLCCVRRCVNPRHVEPVSAAENVHRGRSFAAQLARKTRCKRGHPLEGPNLLPSGLRQRKRRCRTCTQMWAKAQRKRRRV